MINILRTAAFTLALLVGCSMATDAVQNIVYQFDTDKIANELGGRPNSIVIVHLEDPGPEQIAAFQWWKDGIPHIMLPPPLAGFDISFVCRFNHEYAHIRLGLWHGQKPDDTCGPNLGDQELTY